MFDITPVHLHLLVNHIPVIGIMAAVLLLIWAMIRHNGEMKRTALIAFVLVGISAFVADATGDGASAVARHIPGVERADIKAHSQAADYAKTCSLILAVISLVGLVIAARKKEDPGLVSVDHYVRHHHEPNKWIVIACLLIGLFDVTILARVAYLGGAIRHPEIEAGYQAPAAAVVSDSANNVKSK